MHPSLKYAMFALKAREEKLQQDIEDLKGELVIALHCCGGVEVSHVPSSAASALSLRLKLMTP